MAIVRISILFLVCTLIAICYGALSYPANIPACVQCQANLVAEETAACMKVLNENPAVPADELACFCNDAFLSEWGYCYDCYQATNQFIAAYNTTTPATLNDAISVCNTTGKAYYPANIASCATCSANTADLASAACTKWDQETAPNTADEQACVCNTAFLTEWGLCYDCAQTTNQFLQVYNSTTPVTAAEIMSICTTVISISQAYTSQVITSQNPPTPSPAPISYPSDIPECVQCQQFSSSNAPCSMNNQQAFLNCVCEPCNLAGYTQCYGCFALTNQLQVAYNVSAPYTPAQLGSLCPLSTPTVTASASCAISTTKSTSTPTTQPTPTTNQLPSASAQTTTSLSAGDRRARSVGIYVGAAMAVIITTTLAIM